MANQTRPPIVTIMGHVDHGKTSLLDYIRKTKVAAREAGGITQHIGAYSIEFAGHKITFIDTPGHAAFNKMRERGAQVTDFVVLVVAANDGVQPQTLEAIRHIKTAKVPFLVAINKIDLKDVYPDMVKGQLAEHEVLVSGFGGDVDVIELSAKTGQGVDDLLKHLLVMAELHDLKADPAAPLQAVVIESAKDPKRGPVASVIVKQGTLSPKQEIMIEGVKAKVRQLTDENRKMVTSATPGTPVEILGCSVVPAVGAVVSDAARPLPQVEPAEVEEAAVNTDKVDPLANLFGQKPKIKLIIKSDVYGTLEAILNSLDPEATEVLRSEVGEVTEEDIEFAQTTGSLIVVFHTKVSRAIEDRANSLGVKLKVYNVIYQLIDDLQKQQLKLLEPTIDEQIMGEATIKQVFNMRGENIAGVVVNTGRLKLADKFHLYRGEQKVADGEIKTLMHGKLTVSEVKAGEECGLTCKDKRLEFKPADRLVAFIIKAD